MAEMDLWTDRFDLLLLRFLEQENVKETEDRVVSACIQNITDLWSLAKMVDEVLSGKADALIDMDLKV